MQKTLKVTYDIEALPQVFTNLFLTDAGIVLWLYADATLDGLENSHIEKALRTYIAQPLHLEKFGITSASDIRIQIIRAKQNDLESIENLMQEVDAFLASEPTGFYADGVQDALVEYAGWNSAKYDMLLMAMLSATHTALGPEVITSALIRTLSDVIIFNKEPDFKLAQIAQKELEKKGLYVPSTLIESTIHDARETGGHVDFARLALVGQVESGEQHPPALKREMARYGLDIVIDEDVSGQNTSITENEAVELITYNLNDVLGTRLIGQNKVVSNALSARDSIREMYPYTASHAHKRGTKYSPYERDCTAARLASLVLIGQKRIRPKDADTISYIFPVPNAQGDYTHTDLLEYIKEKEAFVPKYFVDFFSHFRGKSVQTYQENMQVQRTQPVTHSAKCNVPYYRDGKPTDAYITVSTGGAHGAVMAGLSRMTEEEIDSWVRMSVGNPKKDTKPTVDLENVIHADWSSFYPVMASKLNMFRTDEGIDRYTAIIKHRFEIKASLPHDRASWTDTDKNNYEQEIGLKLILNSATGAGNTRRAAALLPIDNKVQSMRLIGNMLIWCLGQRLVEAGAFIISTNTDGLYFTNITLERAKEVIDAYVKDYGMGVDPEVVDRFINRDASSRIEILGDHLQEVRGQLHYGSQLAYADDAIGNSMTYPLASAHAVIRYMQEDKDWLNKPYDQKRLLTILEDIRSRAECAIPFYHIYSGTSRRHFLVDGKAQQKVNRVVLTKKGHAIGCETARAPKAEDGWKIYNGVVEKKSLHDIEQDVGAHFFHTVTEENLGTLTFAKKENARSKRDSDSYVVCDAPLRTLETLDDYKARLQDLGATHLAVKGENGQYVAVELWYPTALTNYTSTTAKLLNSMEELYAFDLSELDMQAYLAWSENLLKDWKITADIPALGLQAHPEYNVVPAKKKKTDSKQDLATSTVESLYEQMETRLGV